MTFLREQREKLRYFYRGDFSYFLQITAVAFLLIAIASYIAGVLYPELAERIVSQFVTNISDLGVVSDNETLLAAMLFTNNLRVSFISMVYGLLPLVFLPALVLGINASMIGLMGSYYVNGGMSPWYYLLGLLPHGIFELPALVISMAAGLYLCRTMTQRLKSKKSDSNVQISMKPALFDCVRLLLLQAAPLLFIASLVEAYITPQLLGLIH